MTGEQFDRVVEETLQKCKGIREAKGADYTDGRDRLSNFKEIAQSLGLTPLQVWAVYFMKGITAILRYANHGVLESEPIDARFQDAINYLLLGQAIVKEAGLEPMHTNGWQFTGQVAPGFQVLSGGSLAKRPNQARKRVNGETDE